MTPTLTTDAIPESLTSLDQWICWREDERDGKPTKVPIKPYATRGTQHASATDPETWRGFNAAVSYHEGNTSRTDGVGFIFDPDAEIVGIDLDNCRDPDTEEIDEWAVDIIARLDSYTEVSPSGTGIHVLVQGELPPGRNRRGDVEIYDRDRFFTVTGQRVAETPEEVAQRQDALAAVHYEYVQTAGDAAAVSLEKATETAVSRNGSGDAASPRDEDGDGGSTQPVGPDSGLHQKFGRDAPAVDDPALEAALHGLTPSEVPDSVPRTIDDVTGPGVDLPDADLLDRATGSKSGETIQGLLDGDTALWTGEESRYPSQSEADMGLCFFLGFWTGGDPARMDRLFRESGLYREKWDRQHYGNGATYGAVCLARTLLKLDDYYSPPARSDSKDRQRSSSAGGSSDRVTPAPRETSTTQAGSGRGAENRSVRGSDRIDRGAVEDAQRLATKVKRQQQQINDYEEWITDLKAQVRWYRLILQHQIGESSLPDFEELLGKALDDEYGVREIDPAGEPASPPAGDIDTHADEEETTTAPDGGPERESEDDGGGSRLGQWLRWWS